MLQQQQQHQQQQGYTSLSYFYDNTLIFHNKKKRKNPKNRKIRKSKFWDSRPSQVAIYTVVHEESESEVEKCQILEPGGKI